MSIPRLPVPWRTPVATAQPNLVEVLHFTDAACPWAYNFEPTMRALEARYGDQLHVRTVMIAVGKLSRRIVECAPMMMRAHARSNIRGFSQCAVGAYRQYRNRAAAVIGDEHELPRRMNAQVRGGGAAGAYGAQAFELH